MSNKSYINFQNGSQKLEKAIEEIVPKEKSSEVKEKKRSVPPQPPPRNLSSRSSFSVPIVNTLVTGNSADSSFKSDQDYNAPTGVATRCPQLNTMQSDKSDPEVSRASFPFPEKIPSILSKRSELTDLLMKLLMRRIFVYQSNSTNLSTQQPNLKHNKQTERYEKGKKNAANEEALKLMQYLVLIIFAEDHQAFSIEGYPTALRVHFPPNKVDGPIEGEATSDDNIPMFHYQLNKFPGSKCHFDKQGIPQVKSDQEDEEKSLHNDTVAGRGMNTGRISYPTDSDEDEEEEETPHGPKENVFASNKPDPSPLNNDYMALPEGTTMKQLKSSALQALYGLVMASHVDPANRQRDLHIVRLLAKIHQYYNEMASKLIHAIQENIPLVRVILQTNEKSPFGELEEDCGQQTPLAELAALVRLSFQPEVRQVISDLGGVYALINLLRWEHALWSEYFLQSDSNEILMEQTYQYLQQSVVLRRYICMALTNLTFGSSENKTTVCKRRLCLEALVAQLETDNEDLKQVAASVLRNLSWKTSQMIRLTLRKSHASKRLMKAVLVAQRDSTIKNMLSALWNLSSHSNANKKAICSVEGFLEFFLRTIQRQFEILKCSNDSSLLLVIESCAGIMRNLSGIIASNEFHRSTFTELNGYAIMIDQLSSHSSLTVLVNLINFLHAMTQVNVWPYMDVKEMKQLISCRALQILKEISLSSHHKALVQTAEAVCHNLTAWSPNVNHPMAEDPGNLSPYEMGPGITSLVEDNKSQHLSSAEVVYRRRLNNRTRHPRIGHLSVVFETDSDYYQSSSCTSEEESSDEGATPDDDDSGVPCGGEQKESMLTKNVTRDHSLEERIKVYATEGTPCTNGSVESSPLNSEEEESEDHENRISNGWNKTSSDVTPAMTEDVKPSDTALQSPLIFSRGASSLNSSILDMDNLPPIQSNVQTTYSNSLTACTSAQLSYSVSRPPELNEDETNEDAGLKKIETAFPVEKPEDFDSINKGQSLLSQVIKSAMPQEAVTLGSQGIDYHLNQESDSSTTNSSNSECEINPRPRIAVAPMPQAKSIIRKDGDDQEFGKVSETASDTSSLSSRNKNLVNECISLALPKEEPVEKDSFLENGSDQTRPPGTLHNDELPSEQLSSQQGPLKSDIKNGLTMETPRVSAQIPQYTCQRANRLISAAQSVVKTVIMSVSPEDVCSHQPSLRNPQRPNYYERKPNDFSGIKEPSIQDKIHLPEITKTNETEDDLDVDFENAPLPPPPTRPISVIDYEEVEKEIEEEMAKKERSSPTATLKKYQPPADVKIRKKISSENSLPLPPSPNEYELAILEQYRLSQSSLNSQLMTSTSSNATNTIYDNAPSSISPNIFNFNSPKSASESVGDDKCDIQPEETTEENTYPKPKIVKKVSKLPEPTKLAGGSGLKPPSKIATPSKTSSLPEPKSVQRFGRTSSKDSISSTPSSRSSSIQKKQPVESKLAKLSIKTPTAAGLRKPGSIAPPSTHSTLDKTSKVAQSVPTSPKLSGFTRRPSDQTTSGSQVSSTSKVSLTATKSELPKISVSMRNLSNSRINSSSINSPVKSKILNSSLGKKTITLNSGKVTEAQPRITRPITPSKYAKDQPVEVKKVAEPVKPKDKKLPTPSTGLQKGLLKRPTPLDRKQSDIKPATVSKSQETASKLPTSNIKKTSTGLKLPTTTRIHSAPSTNKSQVLWLSRQELSQR